MTIELMAHPDCRDYIFWANYCKSNEESAVLDISKIMFEDQYKYDVLNATARNLYNRCTRLGYVSRLVSWEERNTLLDDIHAINTSAPMRQGRPMSKSYQERPVAFGTGAPACDLHRSELIGCFAPDGRLVAYITAGHCGTLSASSQIIGHADHLKNGIMYQVWTIFVVRCINLGQQAVVYSRWSDGTDGLRIWKRSVGLKPIILKETL